MKTIKFAKLQLQAKSPEKVKENSGDAHSPFLRAFRKQNGQGHEYLPIEHDRVTKTERFSSMKEKQRPTLTSGLESIEEEFKTL